jgi:hypothetical protein
MIKKVFKMKSKSVGLMNMRVSGNMSLIARLERLEHKAAEGQNNNRHNHVLRVLQDQVEHTPHSRPSSEKKSPGFGKRENVNPDLAHMIQRSATRIDDGAKRDDFDILIHIIYSQQAILNQHGDTLDKLMAGTTSIPGTPMSIGGGSSRLRPGSGQSLTPVANAPDFDSYEDRLQDVEDHQKFIHKVLEDVDNDPEEMDMMAQCLNSLKSLVDNVKLSCRNYESNHTISSMMMKIQEETQSVLDSNDTTTNTDHPVEPQELTFMLEELHWRFRKSVKILKSLCAQEDAEESIRINALAATVEIESIDHEAEASLKARFKDRRSNSLALNQRLEASSRWLCMLLQTRISTAQLQIAVRELQATIEEVKDQKSKATGKLEDIYKTVNNAVSMAQLMEGLKSKADVTDLAKWSEGLRRISTEMQNLRDATQEQNEMGQLRLDIQQLRSDNETKANLTSDQITQIVTELKRIRNNITLSASTQQVYYHNDGSTAPNALTSNTGGHTGISQPLLEKQIRDIVKNKANVKDLNHLRKIMEANGIDVQQDPALCAKSQFKCLSCDRPLPNKPNIDVEYSLFSASQSQILLDTIDRGRPSTAPPPINNNKQIPRKKTPDNQHTSQAVIVGNQAAPLNSTPNMNLEIRSRHPRMVPSLGLQKHRSKVASGGGGFGSVLRQCESR